MTKEEAKGNLIHAFRWNDMPKKEALEIAIKALEQEPQPDIEAIRQIAENELKKFPQLGNAARSIRTIIEEIDKHIQKGESEC